MHIIILGNNLHVKVLLYFIYYILMSPVLHAADKL